MKGFCRFGANSLLRSTMAKARSALRQDLRFHFPAYGGKAILSAMGLGDLKPLEWVGSSKDDLKSFPADVLDHMGFALYLAQAGDKHPDAKPLKGLGASVLEVVSRFDGDAFRAVYTVRFAEAIYVLHAFQKKSKAGIATPKHEIDLVKLRLKAAERHYAEAYGKDDE